MANTIKLKTGSGSDPSASDLIVGEIAIRTDSGKLFTKKDNGTVAEISGGGGIEDGDKGDITVSNGGDTFTIDNGVVTSAKIADGTIVNADISGSAAIAGSKIQAAGLVNAGVMTAAQNNKLAGIEDNATADMTGSEILSTISGENIILGEISSTGNSSFAGNVTISSSDGGSSAAPELDLYRISASPADADYLGQIKFSGESDDGSKELYAKITGKIGDASSGTEDGIIEIAHRKAGSNNISARFTSTDLKLINGTGLEVASNITTNGNFIIESTLPRIYFTDTNNNDDFLVQNNNGQFQITDATNSNATRFAVNSDGHVDVTGNLDVGAGVDVTGNITVSGTVDGRDVASDGTKLDGIESGATADQTASDIKTLFNSSGLVDAQIDASAAIALSKLATGTLPSGLKIDTDNILTGAVTTGKIATGTIINGDISTSAAIAGTKISPNFGSQNISTSGTITLSNSVSTSPEINFTGSGPNFLRFNDSAESGVGLDFVWRDTPNTLAIEKKSDQTVLFSVAHAGTVTVANNLAVGGTVDGRDVATDGSKLDGIESGATADQSASEIKTAYESNSNTNAFTDALLSKLNGIAASATNVTNNNQLTNGAGYITATLTNEQVQDIVGGMLSGNTESGITVTYQDGDGTIDFSVASQTDNNFTNADHSKLDGIESGATADQTASEIRALVESASDSNVFTDADHSKLNGIAAGATNVTNTNQLTNGAGFITATLTNEQVQDIVGGMVSGNTESGITVTYQDGDGTLDFSVASQTDQNFTTTLKNKLDGIASGATNVTNNNQISNGAGYVTSSVINSLNASNLSSGTIPDARFPSTLPAVDGSNLTGISAGATGGGSDEVFYENDQTVTTNYTITNGKNAMAAGPITINSGVTVTVGSGETLTIV